MSWADLDATEGGEMINTRSMKALFPSAFSSTKVLSSVVKSSIIGILRIRTRSINLIVPSFVEKELTDMEERSGV